MSLVSKSFSEIVTFSRSSNATRVGPTGRVEYAPHNLLAYSQQLSNWNNAGSSVVVDNAAAAPDGTITANTFTDTTAASQHYIVRNATVTSGVVHTFSVYAKANQLQAIALRIITASTVAQAYFNLAAGTVTPTSAGSATITNVGNGWYRCAVTGTADSTTASCYLNLLETASSTTFAYAGAGTNLYIWGAQLSVGPYALDYTPTTSAAVYGPRFDYDPVTLAARGLLVEEQRTNLLTYSEQFDNAYWTKTRSSITANAATSPDGTVNADQSTIDSTTGYHDAASTAVSVTSGTAYTISLFAKKNVGIEAIYFYTNATSTDAIAKFNLTTGAYIGNASGNGYIAFSSYSSQSFGNGWYRFTATFTAASTASKPITVGMSTNTNDTVTTLAGNGTDNFYLWGAQLEAGSFATSYLPTLASTVTRSADVASVNTLSPWFNATEGTVYTEFDIIGKTSAFGMTAQIDDGTLNNRILNIGQEASGGDVKTGAFINASSAQQMNEYPVTSMTVGSVYKDALAFQANNCAIVVNGVSITDSSVSLPTGLTTLRIGSRISDGYLNGHMRKLAFYPRRLSAAELTALTA